jgi:membrane-bound lytic murein transglycosylase B
LHGSFVRHSPALARRRWRPWLCAGISIALLISAAAAVGGQPVAAPQRSAPATDRFAAFVTEAARRFGIPEAWIRVVMRSESGGQVHATSPKGAIGLMQIMPGTWSDLSLRYGLGDDPFDPHDNIMAGAGYLRELHDRYGAPGFLAAYNAGPARYEDHLAMRRPLPAETRAYVAALAPWLSGGASSAGTIVTTIARDWSYASLFPTRAGRTSEAATQSTGEPSVRGTSDATSTIPPTLAPRSAGLFAPLSSLAPRR